MPTLWSRTLIPTLRQVPAEAEAPSHQLMLRAGLIRQLGAGLYTYLPAGWRSLKKVIEIIRQEMNAAGAAELLMPALEPLELFRDTKRDIDYGDNLFRLTDRHGRNAALAPTHEEVITEAMMAAVESYRQLPLNLYQIQTKYRDEYRPRFGVLRCREFIMKDAYSFHVAVDGPGGLNEAYDAMYAAYCRIFERCGLKYEVVEAESGPIGGSASHEFMVLCDTGEDTILRSDKGNYSANVEKAGIGNREHSFDGAPTGELEKVYTPDLPGIDEVGKFLKVKPWNMLKVLVYRNKDIVDISRGVGAEIAELARSSGPLAPSQREEAMMRRGESTRQYVPETEWIIAVVRGDHDVNEGKLKAAASCSVQMASLEEARAIGLAVGYISPTVIWEGGDDLQIRSEIFVDPDAAQPGFWATGSNDVDHHVKHFNWKRDVLDHLNERDKQKVHVADIRNAQDGDPSPLNDGGVLRAAKGIEVGHVFKLGTKYSDAMGFAVLDEQQKKRSVIMGCYGIGVGRILASAIETSRDVNGIIWPPAIAPWSVEIVPIKFEGELKSTALELAVQLETAGLDVLIDDRDERPGPKFKDADLLGCPVRITIGEKALAEGAIEFKRRADAGKGELVKLNDVVKRCRDALGI